MRDGTANELLAFEHVRVLNVTPGALRCLIGGKRIWLPREHIKGTLWCRGDSGRLLVRRWVALDRHLTVPSAPASVRLSCQPLRGIPPPRRLHLLRPHLVTNGH
jgi:hypothetical protein